MSLILKRQKCPFSRQICPFGCLMKSILLEVRILLQIQIQMQIQMPFPLNALCEYGLWHWHWLVSSETSCFCFYWNRYFCFCNNFFCFCTSFLFVAISFVLFFYFKTFSNFWVSGAAPVRAKPHSPCICIICIWKNEITTSL